MTITFELVRFNPRRLRRGAEAAEIKVCDNNDECLLWMSASDIRKNIKLFGEQAAFTKALQHYKTRVEFNITSVNL